MNNIKLKNIAVIILFFLPIGIYAQNRTITNQRSMQTLDLLLELSGGAVVWSGQAGVAAMTRINVALARATDLRTSSQVIVYRSAQLIIDGKTENEFFELVGGRESGLSFTGTYIDTMQYLELGISPDLMISILKEVMDIGNANERSSWFMSMLSVTASEAASLTQITVNREDYINSHRIVLPRVERQEREAAEAIARREREAAEEIARRELEAAETAARMEREEVEATARSAQEAAEEALRRARNEGSLLFGYIYDPILPIGLQLGGIGNRWGGYASLSIGLFSHSDLLDINNTQVKMNLLDQLEIKEDIFIDITIGIKYRLFYNLFADIGLGFHGYSLYGLYNVRGQIEPSWYKIIDTWNGNESWIGLSFKFGLMYAFNSFYLSTGYKHYLNTEFSTPTFYIGLGICRYLN
jgi:hypothetical protein